MVPLAHRRQAGYHAPVMGNGEKVPECDLLKLAGPPGLLSSEMEMLKDPAQL